MFDRMRYLAGFAAAYRPSRNAGEDHTAALDTAARDMLTRKLGADGTTGNKVPESAAHLWLDPDPACALPDGAWFGDGSFDVTAPHLQLLRQMQFTWDGAERGAPTLDPRRPYGRRDLLVQLGEVFETDEPDTLARCHVEMLFVLARTLVHGGLTPGSYPLHHADDARRALAGYDGITDADIGIRADDRVEITEDHVKLLRAIDIRWPSSSECADRLAVGEYPAAAADPKRPYGDFTYIEVDMARILGVLPPPPEDGSGIFEPSPELADHLQRLHWQMLVAMQVFVEHADLAPATYGL